MKNLFVFLASIFAGASPLLSQAVPDTTLQAVQPIKTQESGQEKIDLIRKSYERGEYNPFLNELHRSYEQVKEKGELDQLAASRIKSDFLAWSDWESRANTLMNEKRQALLDAVEGHENTPFVDKVRSAASELPDEERQKAISRIAFFRNAIPGSGKNQDENTLIDLDLEYEYKLLHLYLPEASATEKREKSAALKMEHLDKMIAVASKFEDASLIDTVALYAARFDDALAKSWDSMDLSQLINGKRKPADALEEKVASVLQLYLDKFKDLGQEFMREQEKS